jgi:diguanylate cyclase (GGDEF)-like protein
LDTGIAKNKLYRVISEIPLVEVIVFILMTYWTDWVFYIDEDNHYHRSEYTPVHMVVTYGYIIICLIQVIGAIRKKENLPRRKEFRNIFYFVGVTGLFCAVQVVLQGVPLVSMGMTCGIILVYLNSEEMLISLDNLTQLSNRNQLYKHLGAKMQGNHDKHPLYLIVIDVDYFKGINDKYGHIEGDNALKRIADALRLACNDRKTMVCRYGGDEFIIVCDDMKEREVKALISRAAEILAQLNYDADVPYRLTMSMGYAKCTDEMQYMQELIEAADQELYKIKRARDNKASSL